MLYVSRDCYRAAAGKRGYVNVLVRKKHVMSTTASASGGNSVCLRSNIVARVNRGLGVGSGDSGMVSTGKYLMVPKLVSLRIRFESPKRARGRSVRANSQTTTENNIAAIITVPGAAPMVSDPSHMGCIRGGTGRLTNVRILRTNTVARKRGKRRLSSVRKVMGTKVPTLSRSNGSIVGAELYGRTVRITRGFGIPVFTRYRSVSLHNSKYVGRSRGTQELNLPNVYGTIRSIVTTESVLLTERAKTELRLYRYSARNITGVVRVIGRRKLSGVATRIYPRRFVLASSSVGYSSPGCGVGPPLHAGGSMSTLVQKLGSNSFGIVDASRTPRTIPRGANSVQGTTFNVIKVRADFTLSCATLMRAKVLAVSRLVRGVD